MKTRILHTRFWEDDFVSSLTPVQKLLFLYYITNQRIGLTGMYEITNRVVMFETGVITSQLEEAKKIFETNSKIFFYNNWVYVLNSQRINGYRGEKIEPAIEKEKITIPDGVYEYFDTLSRNSDGVSAKSDTPINYKLKIINHKSEEIGEIVKRGKGLDSIDEAYVEHISEAYQVPVSFVRSKLDDLTNWVQEKPTRARGRDLRITLMAWVKKDALERRENVNSKIAYVGDTE